MEPRTALRSHETGELRASVDDDSLNAAGFSPAATIITMEGERQVSSLKVGDRIVSRDNGVARLTGFERELCTTPTVTIRAGSLGHRRPPGDVILPSGTKLFLRDWRAEALYGVKQALVPVHELHDGEFVRRSEACEMELCKLIFDIPHILYVDGLEVACQTPVATR